MFKRNDFTYTNAHLKNAPRNPGYLLMQHVHVLHF